jgi:hypothetical protein
MAALLIMATVAALIMKAVTKATTSSTMFICGAVDTSEPMAAPCQRRLRA